jgi:CheY-like chemotaxis protein
LIGNAVKFTAKGEVEVTVQLVDRPGSRSPYDSFLEFTVRDTGIGIAPEHHGKLFRPFTQVDESTTRRYGGTGLGLAICRSLITMMGGSIHLTSELGRGSSFTFTIRAPVAAALPPPPDLHGMKVGLAIRTPLLRSELAELVRGWNGEPFEAESPEQLVNFPRDAALVELDQETARTLLADPSPLAGLSVETTFGLVPIALSNDLRTELRAHFRLLVNKPVHHGGFFALLSGTQSILPPPTPMTRFGFRVLVIDDNPVNQQLVERVLAKLGCTTTLVNASRAALEQLARAPSEHDLMLLDLQMPGKAGINALREIRAGNAGPLAQSMWIIALTTDAREMQLEGEIEGLNDLLPKPLQIDKLEIALRKFRSERMARNR